MRTLTCRLLILCFFLLAAAVHATTWSQSEVKCPICNTQNTFYEPMSYGSYIYQWPSKYQYIFWPLIDVRVVYICKSCGYAAFMWDFAAPPKDKIVAIRKLLDGVIVQKSAPEYSQIPMSLRLEVAEKQYSVWNKPDDFWCEFYRTVAYHLDAEKKPAAADAARKKALALAEKMLQERENDGIRKEILLIAGAMNYFLGQPDDALKYLKMSESLEYKPKDVSAEQAKDIQEYLTELAKDYIAMAKKRKDLRKEAEGDQ